MPREIIRVRVVREGNGFPDGFGGFTAAGEQDIEGSPFEARFFRAGDSAGGFDRERQDVGETTQEKRRVLTLLDPVAARAILEGDTFIVPACDATGGKETRATIKRIRHYSKTVQCDLETGDARTERVKDHQL